jgi:signal peptidase I
MKHLERISSSAAVWLLERLAPRYRREALAGDLMEEVRRGHSQAWLWRNVLQAISLGLRHVAAGHRPSSAALPRVQRYWRDYRATLAFIVLMLGFRSAWADWVYVPTGSMNPTIIEGDRLLVNKHVYGLRVPFTLIRLTRGEDPQRNDIITFDSPADGTLLVKRVIGVPGDVIAMRDERLTVNGIPSRYSPEDRPITQSLLLATQAEEPQVWRETSGGCTHDILLLPSRPAPSTFGPIVVPPGMYFVLGDNRDDSADSRYIGFVPRRNIIGQATEMLISFDPDRYHFPRTGRAFIPLPCRSQDPDL